MEWLRFCLTAVFLVCGVASIAVSILGTYRFRFALNRMQTAAMTDTFGILFSMLGLFCAYGFTAASIKLVLIVGFMWIASPLSSHLIAALESLTDEELDKHIKYVELKKEDGKDGDI